MTRPALIDDYLLIDDQDNAATLGVPVYIQQLSGNIGSFQAQLAHMASTLFETLSGHSATNVKSGVVVHRDLYPDTYTMSYHATPTTPGVALYVHYVHFDTVLGCHIAEFRCVNANNADAYFVCGTRRFMVWDDDNAATGEMGAVVYTEGNDADERLGYVIADPAHDLGEDLFVRAYGHSGKMLKLKACGEPLAVAFDDDGGTLTGQGLVYAANPSLADNTTNTSVHPTTRNHYGRIFQVYVDYDRTGRDPSSMGKLIINNAWTGEDLLVELMNGDVVRVCHEADAATDGVALYFDDDATISERFVFVSPNNADLKVKATKREYHGMDFYK